MRRNDSNSGFCSANTESACKQDNYGLSTKETAEVCIELLTKANVILSAVACEAIYVDRRSTVEIYPFIKKTIKTVGDVCKILRTMKQSDLSIKENLGSALESVLLMCHKSILELTSMDFYFRLPPNPVASTVFLYLNRSIFLMVDTIDMLASLQGEKPALARCNYQNVTKHDDMISRMEISLRTLVDGLDTVDIVVETSSMEKETFLCATATLLHMSKLFRRDIHNVNIRDLVASCFISRLYFITETVSSLSEYTDIEGVVAISRVTSSINNLALEVSSYWRFVPNQSPRNETADVVVARLGMLEGICATELMKNLWIKEGLKHSSYPIISEVLDCMRNVLYLCLEGFSECTGKASEVSTYYCLLLHADIILEKTGTICIPFSVEDSQKFLDLKQRTINAVERVCEMCTKRIKQIEGVTDPSRVGTTLDTCIISTLPCRRPETIRAFPGTLPLVWL
ncbi:MAG: hypothetical protein AB8U44_01285 [Aaplasma endosymbiont of Hyalomma asiaticum]